MHVPKDFPFELIQKLRSFASPETVDDIVEGWKTERKTTVRVNTLKATPEKFLEMAESEHMTLIPHPFYKYGYILASPSLREFTNSELYINGYCYVQSFSSMLPPILLAPKPGESILDLAAAPGSKTTQMAMIMNNTGTIIANDSSHIRIYKLEANLKQQGVKNVTIHHSHGQTLWQKYPEHFDRVLVDVPCSMDGRIKLSDPKTYTLWSQKKVKELVPTQRFLLKSAVSACKVGGTIVYSTCTLSPEENEGVVDWILKKQAHNLVLETVHLHDVPVHTGLTTYKDTTYNPNMNKTIRIYPNDTFEGFFVACFKKVSSNLYQKNDI